MNFMGKSTMSSSVGIMKFPTKWKVIKFMFQTTNQSKIYEDILMYMIIYINLDVYD